MDGPNAWKLESTLNDLGFDIEQHPDPKVREALTGIVKQLAGCCRPKWRPTPPAEPGDSSAPISRPVGRASNAAEMPSRMAAGLPASTIDVSGEAATSPACSPVSSPARAFAISSALRPEPASTMSGRPAARLSWASFNAIAPPFTISVTDR